MRSRWVAWAAFGAVASLARWRFWPWPAAGEAPALDLVAAYDPALYWAFWLWGHAWPAAAVGVIGSFALSVWDVWGPRGDPSAVRGRLPGWPLSGGEPEPAIVVGEQHHPVDPVEVERPTWLTVPAAGLFTGTAIFGATGSGKTAACMRPFVSQLFSWQAADPDKRASGLVLEVKGDFCRHVRDVLEVEPHGAGVAQRLQVHPRVLDAEPLQVVGRSHRGVVRLVVAHLRVQRVVELRARQVNPKSPQDVGHVVERRGVFREMDQRAVSVKENGRRERGRHSGTYHPRPGLLRIPSVISAKSLPPT